MNKRLSKKILRAVMPAYNRLAFLANTDRAVARMNAYSTDQIGRAIDVNGRVYTREEAAALARRDKRDAAAGHKLGYARWGKWDPYRQWRLRFTQQQALRILARSLQGAADVNLNAYEGEALLNTALVEASLHLLGVQS